MIETILCVAAVTLGVEFGWEPNDGGGLEYIVQIDRESLEGLERGVPLRSDFPRDLRGLQTIRFQLGDKKPPRMALSPLPALEPSALEEKPPKQPAQLAENQQGKPLPARKALFEEPSPTHKPPKPQSETDLSAAADAQRPWLLLYAAVGTSIALATAFGYLLWLHIDIRGRYRALLSERPPLDRMLP